MFLIPGKTPSRLKGIIKKPDLFFSKNLSVYPTGAGIIKTEIIKTDEFLL
jgi:hypothetical protein